MNINGRTAKVIQMHLVELPGLYDRSCVKTRAIAYTSTEATARAIGPRTTPAIPLRRQFFACFSVHCTSHDLTVSKSILDEPWLIASRGFEPELLVTQFRRDAA